MHRLLPTTVLTCLLLAGCASARVDDPVQPAGIGLLPGADAALSRTVALRFDQIADSRCPSNVKCVWAGTVAYHFTLSSRAGKESFKLELGETYDSAHLKGVRVTLGGATPGPVQPLGVAAPPHGVAIAITRH